jgi:hypothetical protein
VPDDERAVFLAIESTRREADARERLRSSRRPNAIMSRRRVDESVDVHFILIKNSDSRVQQRRGLSGTSKLSPLADCKQLVGCISLWIVCTRTKVNLLFDRKLHFSTLFFVLFPLPPARGFPSDFYGSTDYHRKLNSDACRKRAATQKCTASVEIVELFFHSAFSLFNHSSCSFRPNGFVIKNSIRWGKALCRGLKTKNEFEVEVELMMPMPHAIMSSESFARSRFVSPRTKWNAKFPTAECRSK